MVRRKLLTSADVARLRRLAEDGWSRRDLAGEFGCSPQHVGRLLRGEQRATIAGLDARAVRSSVSAATEAFLAGRAVGDGDQVLAEVASTLAMKLDALAASETVAAATAAPRVAAELVSVLERLQERGPWEPDPIDLLKQRRESRLLLLAAANNVDNGRNHEQ
jgi:transcriptional regulator with XRE-family HTH domain